MKVVEGVIYKAKRGRVYDTGAKGRKYNCYSPCMTGDFGIVDCWVCTEEGEVHPGHNRAGCPVDVDSLGKVVGRMEL